MVVAGSQAAQQMANRFYGSRLITVECPPNWKHEMKRILSVSQIEASTFCLQRVSVGGLRGTAPWWTFEKLDAEPFTRLDVHAAVFATSCTSSTFRRKMPQTVVFSCVFWSSFLFESVAQICLMSLAQAVKRNIVRQMYEAHPDYPGQSYEGLPVCVSDRC